MKQVVHLDSIGFTLVCESDEYHANITAYEIVGTVESDVLSGVDGAPLISGRLYNKAGSVCLPDPVSKTEDAEVYLKAFIKWDHCADWWFNEGIHTCSIQDMQNVGALMQAMFNWATENIERFDHY